MTYYKFNLIEIKREEVIKLDSTVQILIYNPNSDMYSIHFGGKKVWQIISLHCLS